MEFEIKYEIYGKKLKTTVQADNESQAKYKLYGKIYRETKIHSIEEKKPIFGKNSIFEEMLKKVVK
jgi:hypothetical protein